MAALSPLLDVLAEVSDPSRAESKLYKLPHVLDDFRFDGTPINDTLLRELIGGNFLASAQRGAGERERLFAICKGRFARTISCIVLVRRSSGYYAVGSVN